MPYICMIRDDIDDGVLQVLDLWPNTSLRNSIYDPVGQTKYVNRLQNDTVVVSAGVTSAAYAGLAAYLIDTVADGTDGGALSATEANTGATDIIAVLDVGGALTVAAINTILDAIVAGTELTANGSVGTLADVLKICAGGEYIVPAGTAADTGAAAFKGTAAGAFTTGQYRSTYAGTALYASIGEGALSQFISATYEYGGVTGAALVVYDNDGTVLS
jgi:hypothetical protein